MNHASLKALGVALVAALPLVASAQLSGNLSLTTNYKFRGQDQDASRSKAVKPAVQGGFDYAFGESGWYVGNWNSSVDWLSGNSIEMDLYGGYKFKGAGLDWDLGALTYVYPGNSTGNTTELYAAATWGPVTAKYSHTVSKDYVKTQLHWLAEQELVSLHDLDGLKLATLTERGHDVQRGLANVPGVARPGA